MFNFSRSVLFALALVAPASAASAQQPAKLRMIGLSDKFVLYASTAEQAGYRLSYTTVIVKGPNPSAEYVISGWIADCKTRKLERISNEVLSETNESLGKTKPIRNYPIDALADIHLKYICDKQLDPRLSALEPIEPRIAVLSAFKTLKTLAETLAP